MYVSITGVENNKDVYINQSYRKENGKTSSRIYRKLGKLNELLRQFDGDFDAMMAWAKSEAEKDTAEYNANTCDVSVSLSRKAYIPKNEERCFQIGYLFLQKLCTELKIDAICRKISKRHKYTYDLGAILTDLIYARILSPSSRLSSFSYCKTLLEPPKYELPNVYRALSVMAGESDLIQAELYKNSNFVHPRNKKVLYYDCTNYYLENFGLSNTKNKREKHRAYNRCIADTSRLYALCFSLLTPEGVHAVKPQSISGGSGRGCRAFHPISPANL